VVKSCYPLKKFLGSNHVTGTAERKVVKICTRVGYINSSTMMIYHPQKGRGYGHVTVLKFFVAACRACFSATAELLVYKCKWRIQISVNQFSFQMQGFSRLCVCVILYAKLTMSRMFVDMQSDYPFRVFEICVTVRLRFVVFSNKS